MDTAQWQAFARQIPQLSHRQRIASSDLLRSSAPQAAAVALIEQTAQAQLHCPACPPARPGPWPATLSLRTLSQNFQCLDRYAAGASAPQAAMAGLRRLFAQFVFGAQGCQPGEHPSQHQFSLAPSIPRAGQNRSPPLPAWHHRGRRDVSAGVAKRFTAPDASSAQAWGKRRQTRHLQ